jgi:hypothetical protein
MSDQNIPQPEPTAVDDVRRVREEIASRHGGDIREHMAETNRLFEEISKQLKLKVVLPPNRGSQRDGTQG